jgi:mannosyl-3-phosphoglycerate phosphatase
LKRKTVVFTDLDGTLLNDNYLCDDIGDLIGGLLDLDVALIFCSSKTRAEIEVYRQQIGIGDPFIAENGAAIFVPKGYFSSKYAASNQVGDFNVIELGMSYLKVRSKIEETNRLFGVDIVGFGDMTAKEISEQTSLPLNICYLAKMRDYDEPFRILTGDENKIVRSFERDGLTVTRGGKFHHLLWGSDKGKATKTLSELYRQEIGDTLCTLGVGDSPNDFPMFDAVDKSFFIDGKSPGKSRREVWNEILCLVSNQSAI